MWRSRPAIASKLGSALVVAIAAFLLATGAASAEPPGRLVPGGLTSTVSTAHFVLHYNPATPSPVAGMSIGQYAQAGAADFEEAYGHDVVGGGLSPNAGLPVPTADDDGKTDVFLSAPADMPEFHGGIVYRDALPWKSAYLFLTPDLPRASFRFRAGHELMHVIQNAYAYGWADGFMEAFANWAAEWALPDAGPLDSNFYGEDRPSAPHPWLPLDCTYGSWKGSPCGNGYWQWLFVQAQVEAFGPGFVRGYYERFAATLDGNVDPLLESQIEAMSSGSQNLRSRFASYAVNVWDPTRWTTGFVRALLNGLGLQPAAYTYNRSTRDTGVQQVGVDHLAARYVRMHNSAEGATPADLLALSWTRPAGMVGDVVPLIKYAGQASWADVGRFAGTSGSVTVPFGPDVEDVVLPLVNDSLTADDQPFSYSMQITEVPDATPPRTRIRKHPPKRTRSHRAIFLFAANEPSRFECRLDGRKFKRCHARTRLHVKAGRHVLRVRAVDTAGNVDKTPAHWAWRVTKPRRKHSKRR